MSGIYKSLLEIRNYSSDKLIPDIKYSPPVSSFNFCPKCGSLSLKHSSKSIWCCSCDFVMFFNSSAAVAGIIEKDDEILFSIRKYEPMAGKLDLPGGFVDPGETAEKALIREIKEELNVDITNFEYITSLSNSYPYKGIEYNTLDMFFYCRLENTDLLIPNDDIVSFKFKAIKKLDIENDIGLESIKTLFRLIEKVSK